MLDLEFEPLDRNLTVYKTAELTPLVSRALQQVMLRYKIRHKTQALRFLVRLAMIRIRSGPESIAQWREMLFSNGDLKESFVARRNTRKGMTLKTSVRDHDFVIDLGWRFKGRSAGYNAAALIGLMILEGRSPNEERLPAIERVEYFPDERVLDVYFESGSRHSYVGVPAAIVNAMGASTSKEKFLDDQIKGRFKRGRLGSHRSHTRPAQTSRGRVT